MSRKREKTEAETELTDISRKRKNWRNISTPQRLTEESLRVCLE